jgi:BASS family bile acid:Na+ symporter
MMLRRALNLLTNRTFILLSAFAAGLVLSDVASTVSSLTMPALAVILTVSTTQFSVREFIPPTRVIRPVLTALVLNFALLGSVILVLAWWLMPTHDLWIGCVLVAVAPPGVAIIPFTHVLRGDNRLSMQGTFGAYLVCLLLTPALVYLLTGTSTVSPSSLIRIILLLVLAPFIAAQLINVSPAAPYVRRWRGNIINWGFFLVIFTVVGLNRSVFLGEPKLLAAVSAPALVSSFGLSFLVDGLGKRLGVAQATRSSAILLSTIKNSAFAAAIGLSLYSEASSIPGAVFSAWYALYFIYLGIKGDRERAMA